jgi:tetratricopeptide (TPR) repeat protein
MYYFNQGKLNESLKELNKMVEFFPGPWIYDLWQQFYIYDRQKDDLHALMTLKELMVNDSSILKYLPLVDTVYQKSGMNGIYSKMAEVLSQETNASPLSVAQLYARLGKKEEAITWLRKALDNRNVSLPNINNDPRCARIRQEPGFIEIIDKLGLKPYFDPSKDFSPIAD